jgi:hypothetical protein
LLTAWTTDDAIETTMLHLFNSMRMKWISRCKKLIVGVVLHLQEARAKSKMREFEDRILKPSYTRIRAWGSTVATVADGGLATCSS